MFYFPDFIPFYNELTEYFEYSIITFNHSYKNKLCLHYPIDTFMYDSQLYSFRISYLCF